MFKGFKAVGVCGVVVCKDNDKGDGCSIVVVGGCNSVVGRFGICVWIVVAGLRIERTPTHALPQTKPPTL